MATISLISQSLNNTDKIKHIFFAKEIVAREEYEIIDLKEYLELANMSYVLESFNYNYTVALVSKFKNKNFRDLTSQLSTISNHILSNSLKALNNDVGKILNNIDFILKNEQIDGMVKAFFENGKLMGVANFKDGLQDGEAIEYDKNGNVIKKVLYKNGNIVK